ncbi:MAG: ABC transporter ATP-binding protein [Thermodesulfobacteriota bacterium]
MVRLIEISKAVGTEDKIHYIIKNISFSLDTGKLAVISGRSGAGKTTLLHLIAGLDVPTDGECWIDEICISKLDSEKRARFRLENIGFVFQSFNFLPSLTIAENISVPAYLNNGIKNSDIERKVKSITKILGINSLFDRYPDEVSGGEIQRASIARALINSPKIILADEPTGNLDTENREIVLQSFKKIIDEFGVTVLMATHDKELERSADTIFHLNDGALLNYNKLYE